MLSLNPKARKMFKVLNGVNKIGHTPKYTNDEIYSLPTPQGPKSDQRDPKSPFQSKIHSQRPKIDSQRPEVDSQRPNNNSQNPQLDC